MHSSQGFLEGSRRQQRQIVTPEGVPIPIELADYGERLIAFAIDWFIWTLLSLVFFLAILGAIGTSGFSLIAMATEGRGLILLVVAMAAGSFCANVLMAGTRLRSLRAAAQIIGAIGLTSTAAGAYYAVAGTIDVRAIVLWLASWLFAAAQIAYVQLRLRTVSARSPAEKLRAGWKVYVLHLALPLAAAIAAMFGLGPWLLVLAFVPAAARLAIWAVSPPARIRIHRLGFTELIHNLTFAGLLVAALLP